MPEKSLINSPSRALSVDKASELENKTAEFRALAARGEINSDTVKRGWELFRDIDSLKGGATQPHIREAIEQMFTGKGDNTAASLAHFSLQINTFKGSCPNGTGKLLQSLGEEKLEKAKRFCRAMDSAQFEEGAVILSLNE